VRWLVLIAAVGCTFTPGELPRDGAIGDDGPELDATPDVSDDAMPSTCNARWRNGSIRFGTPVILTAINSIAYDRDPFLAPNELTMWVSSGRTGGTGGTVWIAKRNATTDAFNAPQVDTSFDSPGNETKLSITADGKYAVVGSDRTGSASVDVWEAQRATVNDNWSLLSRTNTSAVNTSGADHDPTVSADGLRLYLAPANGTQHISVATRADRASAFSAPIEIAELTSGMGDADPSPTPDEQILLFASNRSGGMADPAPPNVYYATRAGSTGTFDPPLIVPDINTNMPEGDPHLSTDGCRIYFARDLGSDNFEIFVAAALP
jgi:hypothetical protein